MEGSMWADRILMDREDIISTFDTLEYIKKNVQVSYQGKVSDDDDDEDDNDDEEDEKNEKEVYCDAVGSDEDVLIHTENQSSVRVCEILQKDGGGGGYGEDNVRDELRVEKHGENIHSIAECKIQNDGGVGVKDEVREIHKVNKSYSRVYSSEEKIVEHQTTEGKSTNTEAFSGSEGHQHSQQNPTSCAAASSQAQYCQTCLIGPRCCVDQLSPDTVPDNCPANAASASEHETAATINVSSSAFPENENNASSSTPNDISPSKMTNSSPIALSKPFLDNNTHTDSYTSSQQVAATSFDIFLDPTSPDTGSSYSSSHNDSDSDGETVISVYLTTNKSDRPLSVVEYEYYVDEDDVEGYDHDYDSLCGSEEEDEEEEKDGKQMRGVYDDEYEGNEGQNGNRYDHDYLQDGEEDHEYFSEYSKNREEILEDGYKGDEYLVDEEEYDEEEEEYLVDDAEYQEEETSDSSSSSHSRHHDYDHLSYYQEPLEVILEILGEEEEEENGEAGAVEVQTRKLRDESEDLITFSYSEEFSKNDVNVDENIVVHEDVYSNSNAIRSSFFQTSDEDFRDYVNIENFISSDVETRANNSTTVSANSKNQILYCNTLTSPVKGTECKDDQSKQGRELLSPSSTHTIDSRFSHLGSSRPPATGEGSDTEKLRCLTTEIESYLKETTKLLEKVSIYTKVSPSVPREADLVHDGQGNSRCNSRLPHENNHCSQVDDLSSDEISETFSTTTHTQESTKPQQTVLTKTRSGLDVENLCLSIQDQFNFMLKDVEAAGRQPRGTPSLPYHHHQHHHQQTSTQHDQERHRETDKRSGTHERKEVCNKEWRKIDPNYSTFQINTGITKDVSSISNIREELHPKRITPEKYLGNEHGHDNIREDVISLENRKQDPFSYQEGCDNLQNFRGTPVEVRNTEKVTITGDCQQNSLTSSVSHEVFETLMETRTSMESKYFSAAEASTDAVDALDWEEERNRQKHHQQHRSRIFYKPPERSEEDEFFFTSLDNTQDYSWMSSSEDYGSSSLDPEVMCSLNTTNAKNGYSYPVSEEQLGNTSVHRELMSDRTTVDAEQDYRNWNIGDHVSSRPIDSKMFHATLDDTTTVSGDHWKATSEYSINILDPELLASLDPLQNCDNKLSSLAVSSIVAPPERFQSKSQGEVYVGQQVNGGNSLISHDTHPSASTSPDYENIFDAGRDTSSRNDSPPPTVPCLDNLEKLYRRLSQEYDIDLSNLCTMESSELNNRTFDKERGTPVVESKQGKYQRNAREKSINSLHLDTSEVSPQYIKVTENSLRIQSRENVDTDFISEGTERRLRRSTVCSKLDEILNKTENASPENVKETDAASLTSVDKPMAKAEIHTHTDESFSHLTDHVEVAGIQHQLNEILNGLDVMYNRYMEKNRKANYEQCTHDINNKTRLKNSTSEYPEELDAADQTEKCTNTSSLATEKSSYLDILNISEDLKHICVFHVSKPGDSSTPSGTQGNTQESRTDTTKVGEMHTEVMKTGCIRIGNQSTEGSTAGQGNTHKQGIIYSESQHTKESHGYAAGVHQCTTEGYRYNTEDNTDKHSGCYQYTGSTRGMSRSGCQDSEGQCGNNITPGCHQQALNGQQHFIEGQVTINPKYTLKGHTPGSHTAILTPAERLMELIEYESNVATFLTTIREENRECYAAAARYLHKLLASVTIPEKLSGPALPLATDLTHSQVGEGVGCQES